MKIWRKRFKKKVSLNNLASEPSQTLHLGSEMLFHRLWENVLCTSSTINRHLKTINRHLKTVNRHLKTVNRHLKTINRHLKTICPQLSAELLHWLPLQSLFSFYFFYFRYAIFSFGCVSLTLLCHEHELYMDTEHSTSWHSLSLKDEYSCIRAFFDYGSTVQTHCDTTVPGSNNKHSWPCHYVTASIQNVFFLNPQKSMTERGAETGKERKKR